MEQYGKIYLKEWLRGTHSLGNFQMYKRECIKVLYIVWEIGNLKYVILDSYPFPLLTKSPVTSRREVFNVDPYICRSLPRYLSTGDRPI